MRQYTIALLLAMLVPGGLYAQLLPYMQGFMQLDISMKEEKATALIDKLWPEKNLTDTGPLRIYVLGKPDDEDNLKGAQRLLVYYMGEELACKELRLSATDRNVRPTLDSVKQLMIKKYGNPGIDSSIDVPGFIGAAKLYSWAFPANIDKGLCRADLAAYKVKDRGDYTIVVAIFTNHYDKMIPQRRYPRNYLHY